MLRRVLPLWGLAAALLAMPMLGAANLSKPAKAAKNGAVGSSPNLDYYQVRSKGLDSKACKVPGLPLHKRAHTPLVDLGHDPEPA